MPENDTPSPVNSKIVAAQIITVASSFAGGVVACLTMATVIANPIGIALGCGLACLAIGGLIFIGINGSKQDLGLTLFFLGSAFILGFGAALIPSTFLGGSFAGTLGKNTFLVFIPAFTPLLPFIGGRFCFKNQ